LTAKPKMSRRFENAVPWWVKPLIGALGGVCAIAFLGELHLV
jgi:hypothetical protein